MKFQTMSSVLFYFPELLWLSRIGEGKVGSAEQFCHTTKKGKILLFRVMLPILRDIPKILSQVICHPM